MKTEYEFIHFVKIADKTRTSVWSCQNNKTDDELGKIEWYPGWRQYCYFPTVQAVYSIGCLVNIAEFISQLMKERAENGKNKEARSANN
jgi:hypothetical protein